MDQFLRSKNFVALAQLLDYLELDFDVPPQDYTEYHATLHVLSYLALGRNLNASHLLERLPKDISGLQPLPAVDRFLNCSIDDSMDQLNELVQTISHSSRVEYAVFVDTISDQTITRLVNHLEENFDSVDLARLTSLLKGKTEEVIKQRNWTVVGEFVRIKKPEIVGASDEQFEQLSKIIQEVNNIS